MIKWGWKEYRSYSLQIFNQHLIISCKKLSIANILPAFITSITEQTNFIYNHAKIIRIIADLLES